MAERKAENLIPQSERTKEEQSKIARMGGKASGEARRRKRDIRLAMEALLEKEYKGKHGERLSGAEAIAVKQMEKALKGDTRAFEVVRDSAGQKPVDKVMVSEVEQSIIDEIENIVLDEQEEYIPPKRAIQKPVVQYTINGDFVAEYESGSAAGKSLNVNSDAIRRCARGERKTAYGYVWEYKE